MTDEQIFDLWTIARTCGPKEFGSALLAESDKQEAVAIVERKAYWGVRPLIDWEKIGDGTKLYAHPIASADAELARLREENEELAKFVIAVGGFWGHSKSTLIGEFSLAACIQRAFDESEKTERYQRMNSLLHKILRARYEESKRLKARIEELEETIAANRASEEGEKS